MSFLDTLRSGWDSISSPLKSMVGGLAPIAGGMLGGALGGPMGGAIGTGLGGGFSNWLNSGNQQNPMPSHYNAGQIMGHGLNQMVPQPYQGQTFGQIGRGIQGQAGNYLNNFLSNQGGMGSMLGQLGVGNRIASGAGDFLSNQLQRYAPTAYNFASNLSGYSPNDLSSSLANRFQQTAQPFWGQQNDGGRAPAPIPQMYGGNAPGMYNQGQMAQIGQVPNRNFQLPYQNANT